MMEDRLTSLEVRLRAAEERAERTRLSSFEHWTEEEWGVFSKNIVRWLQLEIVTRLIAFFLCV